MNYKLIKTNKNWCILETHTQQCIEYFDCFIRAKKRLKHFNFGGGFDGFTPSFVLIKIPKT